MRVAVVWCCLLVVLAGCMGAPSGTGSATDTPVSGPSTTSDRSTTLDDPTANGTLSVHFINVGQSAATLVVGPTGETMLVDTGDYADDGRYVLAYLQRLGIDRIDYLVTSHADADHIGGHAAVIEYFETQKNGVGAVYDPGIASSTRTYEEYLDAIERYDVPLYETRSGDTIPFAGVDTSVLGPPETPLANRERNENSIVLRLAFGTRSFLLTGDGETEAERYLVERYGDRLRSTVLQAGHHGSQSSTHESLLDVVRPTAVVVSSAYDSRYGHPHEETLRRLAGRSIPTYWTATQGDVVFVTDGRSLTVETQREAPTDPLRLRDAPPVAPDAGGAVESRRAVGADAADDGPSGDRGPAVADGGRTTERIGISVHADAAGDDRTNLDDEYVIVENTGNTTLDLSGWTITDEAGHTYAFSDGTTLAPGAQLTLHTGAGDDGRTDRYWGASSPVWNNDGDTVILANHDGEPVVTETYP